MRMIDRRRGQYAVIGVLALWLLACTGVPEGVDPVTGFDQNRYLGTWYEIARLDHSFEHGLSEVSATYDVNPDGSISFFGPFYGSYVVFELGEDYDYAFVSGFNRSYLWFLARTPQVSEALRAQFLQRITELGFDPAELIWLDKASEAVANR